MESIASPNQAVEKVLRLLIAFLKQSLEDGKVEEYSWIEGKEIVAEVLTMQRSMKEVLD